MLFLICFITHVLGRPIAPRFVIAAIDSGSNLMTRSSIGVKFQPDRNHTGNSIDVDYYQEVHNKRQRIKYTEDYNLYLTQRQGRFSYGLFLGEDLPEFQKYVLVLQFAELHYTEPDQRIFDVAIGSRRVVEMLDVVAKAGPKTAHEEYIEIQLDKGKVYYEGMPCQNAINFENELVVHFLPVVDQAMVSSLYLFKGPLSETDHADKEAQRQKWEDRYQDLTPEQKREIRQKRAAQKEEEIKIKKEKLKIRPGFQHEIEQAALETKKLQFEWPDLKIDLFLYMLQTPLGAVMIVGFLCVMFVTISFVFFDPYGQKKLMKEYSKIRSEKTSRVSKKDA